MIRLVRMTSIPQFRPVAAANLGTSLSYLPNKTPYTPQSRTCKLQIQYRETEYFPTHTIKLYHDLSRAEDTPPLSDTSSLL